MGFFFLFASAGRLRRLRRLAHTSHTVALVVLLVRVVAGRRVCLTWSPGFPRRPPIVICTQSVGPVRVRDGAAIGIHRQRVDCARVRDGAAVVICYQDVVPCHVGRVVSCRVAKGGHNTASSYLTLTLRKLTPLTQLIFIPLAFAQLTLTST